jgi:hypothetical protein
MGRAETTQRIAAAGGSPTTRCSSGSSERRALHRGAIERADQCEDERHHEKEEEKLRQGDTASDGENQKDQNQQPDHVSTSLADL